MVGIGLGMTVSAAVGWVLGKLGAKATYSAGKK